MSNEPELDYWLATEKFYEVLFAKIPGFEKVFSDENKQKTMMLVALQRIGDKARGDQQLNDYMKMLGQNHRSYGLTVLDMENGREAFEQAIEAGGNDLSSERKQHYLDAFTELERAMGFNVGSTGEG